MAVLQHLISSSAEPSFARNARAPLDLFYACFTFEEPPSAAQLMLIRCIPPLLSFLELYANETTKEESPLAPKEGNVFIQSLQMLFQVNAFSKSLECRNNAKAALFQIGTTASSAYRFHFDYILDFILDAGTQSIQAEMKDSKKLALDMLLSMKPSSTIKQKMYPFFRLADNPETRLGVISWMLKNGLASQELYAFIMETVPFDCLANLVPVLLKDFNILKALFVVLTLIHCTKMSHCQIFKARPIGIEGALLLGAIKQLKGFEGLPGCNEEFLKAQTTKEQRHLLVKQFNTHHRLMTQRP